MGGRRAGYGQGPLLFRGTHYRGTPGPLVQTSWVNPHPKGAGSVGMGTLLAPEHSPSAHATVCGRAAQHSVLFIRVIEADASFICGRGDGEGSEG